MRFYGLNAHLVDNRIAVDTPEGAAMHRIEVLTQRIREFLLTLPEDGRVEMAEAIEHELDHWEQWIQRVGTWRVT
jgi:hypothetical protein